MMDQQRFDESCLHLVSILIRGNIWRQDLQPLSYEEFWGKFIEFIKSNGWDFGGSTNETEEALVGD